MKSLFQNREKLIEFTLATIKRVNRTHSGTLPDILDVKGYPVILPPDPAL